jgi:hypothetical protein
MNKRIKHEKISLKKAFKNLKTISYKNNTILKNLMTNKNPIDNYNKTIKRTLNFLSITETVTDFKMQKVDFINSTNTFYDVPIKK